MRWPWTRDEERATPTPVEVPRRDWERVPPTRSVVPTIQRAADTHRFTSSSFASWQDPTVLAPLTHAVRTEGPSGVADGLLTIAPAGPGASGLAATTASSSAVPVQREVTTTLRTFPPPFVGATIAASAPSPLPATGHTSSVQPPALVTTPPPATYEPAADAVAAVAAVVPDPVRPTDRGAAAVSGSDAADRSSSAAGSTSAPQGPTEVPLPASGGPTIQRTIAPASSRSVAPTTPPSEPARPSKHGAPAPAPIAPGSSASRSLQRSRANADISSPRSEVGAAPPSSDRDAPGGAPASAPARPPVRRSGLGAPLAPTVVQRAPVAPTSPPASQPAPSATLANSALPDRPVASPTAVASWTGESSEPEPSPAGPAPTTAPPAGPDARTMAQRAIAEAPRATQPAGPSSLRPGPARPALPGPLPAPRLLVAQRQSVASVAPAPADRRVDAWAPLATTELGDRAPTGAAAPPGLALSVAPAPVPSDGASQPARPAAPSRPDGAPVVQRAAASESTPTSVAVSSARTRLPGPVPVSNVAQRSRGDAPVFDDVAREQLLGGGTVTIGTAAPTGGPDGVGPGPAPVAAVQRAVADSVPEVSIPAPTSVTVQAEGGPPPVGAATRQQGGSPADLDELAKQLYRRIRTQLAAELRIDRERAGVGVGLER